MANIQLYYTEPIEQNKSSNEDNIKSIQLQKQWLKKNKPKYFINSEQVTEKQYKAKYAFYSCPTREVGY